MKKPSATKKKAKKKGQANKAQKKARATEPGSNRSEPTLAAQPAPPLKRFNDEDRVVLTRLAEGVWRLQRRAEEPWAKHLVEYFSDSLRELDVEILDRTGSPFRDGENVEVLHSEAPEGCTEFVITEVIRPTIRVGGQIVQQGQVVLGPGGDRKKEKTCQEK